MKQYKAKYTVSLKSGWYKDQCEFFVDDFDSLKSLLEELYEHDIYNIYIIVNHRA